MRARQFELISLRELVLEKALSKVIPILEPVKETFNNLNLAHKVFQENDFYSYLIVNPLCGEKSGDTDHYLDYLEELDALKFKHAFHFNDNLKYIEESIERFNIQDCMLICLDKFSDEEAFRSLCQNPVVTHIVLLEPHKNRTLDRFIKSLNKFYIRLDDVFEKQTKNADFLDITAHKFTEEHLYFLEDNYQGFSDYTVLSSEFIDGGSTPRAVVIHLTYLNEDFENQIWIRHFTSVSNDSIANVQGKFAEAAQKAIEFCNALPLNNSAVDELRKYYEESRYPGLGVVKKVSMKNHLLIVNNFLN